MLPARTILHPTDFSECSQNAFEVACALSRSSDVRLVALHVVTPAVVYGEGVVLPGPFELVDSGRQQLEDLQSPEADVHLEHRLEVGEPASEILRVADEIDADLIVLGTHGRTGLGRVLMGSVAEQVVRRASCPVLTVTVRVARSSGATPARSLAGTVVP